MKPSTAKTKGAQTETAFVDWIKLRGVPNAERRHLSGQFDKGDIAGWVKGDGSKSVAVEVKSGGSLKIPQWIKELEFEVQNAKADTGFIAVRPSGKPKVDDWWAILPIPVMMQLLEEAGYLPTS